LANASAQRAARVCIERRVDPVAVRNSEAVAVETETKPRHRSAAAKPRRAATCAGPDSGSVRRRTTNESGSRRSALQQSFANRARVPGVRVGGTSAHRKA
jgi:hypothetical protein